MPIAFGEVVETAVAVGLAAALGEAGVAAALALMGGGRRRFKSLYERLKAEVRRQMGRGRERKRRFSFHYDPFSYALNFDDGCSGEKEDEIELYGVKGGGGGGTGEWQKAIMAP